MSKNIKNLLIVLCLVGVVGQSEEAQAYSFDLAALTDVDPMTVGCSIAGAAGVYTVASAIGNYFSCSSRWDVSAETKVIAAKCLRDADEKVAALHSSYDLYNLSEQGLYGNINKCKDANSIRCNSQAIKSFFKELTDCIDSLCYYNRWENGYSYDDDFKEMALNDYRDMSWTGEFGAKRLFFCSYVSSDFRGQFKALNKYYKQFESKADVFYSYAVLRDAFNLFIVDGAVDVEGLYSFVKGVNNFSFHPYFTLNENLPHSSVVDALENCLGRLADTGVQGLPWLKNEMKRFEPQVRAIIKSIKSSNEYRQERLAVVQSGKVWVD